MPVTMRDVAQRAGVSKAAVSYVLNGRADSMRIPEETRRRILDSVRALGYHPNALARGLAHQRTDTIAVVMQFPSLFSGWSGFTNEMMRGVTDAAVRLGYHVMLCTRQPQPSPASEDGDALAAEVAALTEGRVDGALLLRDRGDPLAPALARRGFPAVLMFTSDDAPDLWYVDCDNVRGGALAAEHLLALGHRRILHLAGPDLSAAAADRAEGYRRALERAGVAYRPEWAVRLPDPGGDFCPAARIFAAPPGERPTAVFAWSDEVAARMTRTLRALGLRVPHDVAVVGFDSTSACDHTDPPLTSVRQPIYDMASQALALLARRIAGETPGATRVRVAPALTVRRSCGASA